ncbi:MAG: 50S ribosomal protein L13 [Actinobacteria bacterium]|nr:MAG: 50S ribosomal protein L13 [Actinomycetota bacterium]
MKTYSPKPEHIERSWYVVDASGQVLGRLASEVATLLRGKHKPIFAPHMDTGDHVVVINADKVELSGNKAQNKFAYRHSGYPGGITGIRYADLLATRPVAAVEKAIRGMLPKNRLGRQQIKKLHVVAGAEHPHSAQKPVRLTVGERPRWSGLPTTVLPSRMEAKPPIASKTPAKEPTAEKAPGKKTPAKKTTAKKTTAKKPAAKKTTATKPAATTSAAKKQTSKKTTAKKSAAKKPAKTEE